MKSISHIIILLSMSVVLAGCASGPPLQNGPNPYDLIWRPLENGVNPYDAFLKNGPFANGVLFGGLFCHTVEPLTINQNATEVRESLLQGRGAITQVSDPLTSGISVRLGKNGLGDIAKKHGIETIYYADIERWSAVFGLWQKDVVHIYGK